MVRNLMVSLRLFYHRGQKTDHATIMDTLVEQLIHNVTMTDLV
jgi:hypothetical protein